MQLPFSKKIRPTKTASLIVITCLLLVVINVYTIKILAASRAYTNAQYECLKESNNTILVLVSYLFTSNSDYWIDFNKHIAIPKGDSKARIALTQKLDIEIAKEGFRAGKNDEADLDNMIWLFDHFNKTSFLKTAILGWEQADDLTNQLFMVGRDLNSKVESNQLDPKMQIILLAKITELHKKITVNHDALANSFANGTQRLKYWLLIANLIFIILIITAVTIHYTSLIKKLLYSKQKLKLKKEKLHTFIKDLEKTKENLSIEIIQHKKIIGTISHDIRSPLKYIQLIAEYLSNTTKKNGDLVSNKHASSIQKSSAQLYDFTKTLIHYSQIYIEDKNYQQKPYLVYDLVESKKSLFEEIALNNNTKIINVTNQNLNSDLNINIISIVIHNLLDNAVKNTHNGSIEVGAKFENKKLTYWVKDSGSGMNEDIINYYMNLFNKKNSEKLILSISGMGLHLVLELLILLKGKISFSSTDNIGTVVTIEI